MYKDGHLSQGKHVEKVNGSSLLHFLQLDLLLFTDNRPRTVLIQDCSEFPSTEESEKLHHNGKPEPHSLKLGTLT